MRGIMDVRCTECGEVNEVYARIGDDCTCPACSSTYRVERANKLISPVRCSLAGVAGDFPGAAMKWTRQHEQGAKKGG